MGAAVVTAPPTVGAAVKRFSGRQAAGRQNAAQPSARSHKRHRRQCHANRLVDGAPQAQSLTANRRGNRGVARRWTAGKQPHAAAQQSSGSAHAAMPCRASSEAGAGRCRCPLRPQTTHAQRLLEPARPQPSRQASAEPVQGAETAASRAAPRRCRRSRCGARPAHRRPRRQGLRHQHVRLPSQALRRALPPQLLLSCGPTALPHVRADPETRHRPCGIPQRRSVARAAGRWERAEQTRASASAQSHDDAARRCACGPATGCGTPRPRAGREQQRPKGLVRPSAAGLQPLAPHGWRPLRVPTRCQPGAATQRPAERPQVVPPSGSPHDGVADAPLAPPTGHATRHPAARLLKLLLRDGERALWPPHLCAYRRPGRAAE